jgi:hypothetical protein
MLGKRLAPSRAWDNSFAETVIMRIHGWGTRSVFQRYVIVSRRDIVDEMRKLQINLEESQIGHEIGPAAQADLGLIADLLPIAPGLFPPLVIESVSAPPR